jgi:hypothetical protein
MKRRAFLSTTAGTAAFIAGCTDNNETGDSPENTDNTLDNDTNPDSEGDTETTPEYDAVIEYTTHIQEAGNGEYHLPEQRYEDWSWIVMDFEVIEGQLDMEDVWFNGLLETEERYYTVSKQTDQTEDGIESRGAIRHGNRGLTLHEYPPSPASSLVGPVFSATDTSIGGEEVGTTGPTDLYPPVTVEYSVETTQNPESVPDEYEPEQGNSWAVVNLHVANGVLNLEDVWFRSQLLTDARVYECHPYSRFVDRGVRSRGLVKEGFSANALYQVANDEDIEEWGYTEDSRQDVTIRRM